MISPVTATKNQMDSPELFERSFTRILKKAKSKNKIVVVIDNLDRVDSKVATEVLATLKTFLEIKNGDIDGKEVIFLVPCDFEAVKKAAPSAELADEFLRKIFNVVVWTPEYIDTDIRSFIKEQIKQTGDIKVFLEDEDVYLVIESAFANSPREIKQFINNLISSLVVAFNTEVKEIVEKDVAYMAKVLVLMHKYPTAFQNLKKLWHAPEEVISSYKSVIVKEDAESFREEFENFMLKTSRITVDDAEPFIYLKKPVVSSQLNDAEAIRVALIDGDETSAKSSIESETQKTALLDFIVSILNKYQNQTIDIITNIYRTQLIVLSNFGITDKGYINTIGLLLDSKVWPSFQELPTDIIFSFILSDNNLDNKTRINILERYIVAISSTEEFKNFQKIEIVKTIIKNLIQYQDFLTSEQRTNFAQAIEQVYSGREDVVSLFIDANNKDKFITKKTLEQVIQTSTVQNFTLRKDVVFGFKKLISNHKLFPLLYQKFTELLAQHNQKVAGFSEDKELFLKEVLKLIGEFESELEQVGAKERADLVVSVIQTFNNISPWDSRLTLMSILKSLEDITIDAQKNEIKSLATQFLQNASPAVIENFLNFWDSGYAQGVLSELLPQLQQRILTQPDFAKVIYSFSNEETRLSILKHLITNQQTIAMEFVDSLDVKEYKRIEVARMFLEKAQSLAGADRLAVYNFIYNKINKKDDTAIKDIASEQIKGLLNQDNEANASIGLDFFMKAEFLSEEKKREIVKSTLEFIRQPGRTITMQHQNALKAITTFFNDLQDTPQKDYVFFLFSLIKDGQSEDVVQMTSNNLLEIKPLFKDYQKDYKDLAESIASWGSENTKKIVIHTLLQLKPIGRISAEENKYWAGIETLRPKDN